MLVLPQKMERRGFEPLGIQSFISNQHFHCYLKPAPQMPVNSTRLNAIIFPKSIYLPPLKVNFILLS